jgi:hypothetical protein
MSSPVVTCPVCRMRVLPGPDNRCPSCRGYDFSTGAAAPDVVAKESLKRPAPAQVARVALMHWLTAGSLVVVILVAVFRFFVRLSGRYALRDVGFDYEFLLLLNGLVGVIAALTLIGSARKLGQSIGLDRWFNVFVLLKESSAYFREKGIRVGLLGPSLSQINRATSTEEGRPTRG